MKERKKGGKEKGERERERERGDVCIPARNKRHCEYSAEAKRGREREGNLLIVLIYVTVRRRGGEGGE